MDSNLVDYMYMQTISLFSKRKSTSICMFCLPSQNTDITWRCRREICPNDNIDSLAVKRSIWTWHTQVEHLDALVHPFSILPSLKMQALAWHVCPVSFFKYAKNFFMGFFSSQRHATPQLHVFSVSLLNHAPSTSMGCFSLLSKIKCKKADVYFSSVQIRVWNYQYLLFYFLKAYKKLAQGSAPSHFLKTPQ